MRVWHGNTIEELLFGTKQYAWLCVCWTYDFVPYCDYWKFSENEHPVADRTKFSSDLARLFTGVLEKEDWGEKEMGVQEDIMEKKRWRGRM